ncbi:MAG: sensor histidine kinase, partial [Promethearchaeota archaeon]
IRNIYDESEKMAILLENFLNDTTNENGLNSLNLKKENITNIIENCIKNSKDLAKKRNLSLSINIPRYLIFKVDKVKFEVIIRNLLSNAIKNTPPNGKICIETQKYENYFDIIISDNGIGFTENEKKNIFKKFGKIKRDNKNFDIDTGGYGLGLYISKKIVQLHGGKIWVESKGRNKGSSFIIRIPTNHSS